MQRHLRAKPPKATTLFNRKRRMAHLSKLQSWLVSFCTALPQPGHFIGACLEHHVSKRLSARSRRRFLCHSSHVMPGWALPLHLRHVMMPYLRQHPHWWAMASAVDGSNALCVNSATLLQLASRYRQHYSASKPAAIGPRL